MANRSDQADRIERVENPAAPLEEKKTTEFVAVVTDRAKQESRCVPSCPAQSFARGVDAL
jgi:hypothetical protein